MLVNIFDIFEVLLSFFLSDGINLIIGDLLINLLFSHSHSVLVFADHRAPII